MPGATGRRRFSGCRRPNRWARPCASWPGTSRWLGLRGGSSRCPWGVVPLDGEANTVLACGGGAGVAGFRRGEDRLGRAVGLGAEGWGGGAGCGGGGVSAFRVGCAGAG